MASPPPGGYNYNGGPQYGYQQAKPNLGIQHILQNQEAYAAAAGGMQPMMIPVGDDEYNRLLKNYKLAHERIEETRLRMLEQEKQNALLRKHILLLEGGDSGAAVIDGRTVDDFTIKTSSSNLERRINRFAADTIAAFLRVAPRPPPGTDLGTHLALIPLAEAIYSDLENESGSPFLDALAQAGFDYPGLALVVQSLLRHVFSQMLSEGIINQLLVTNSVEANGELSKIHEQLFNREPMVASVWRRQAFSAAVERLDREMMILLFEEHMPRLFGTINPNTAELTSTLSDIMHQSHVFSRMLHASRSPGTVGLEGNGFYRAFVPDLGSPLDQGQLELMKYCSRTERGEPERVGACLFPGLVKVTLADTPQAHGSSTFVPGERPPQAPKKERKIFVVRRALVICECALARGFGGSTAPTNEGS